MKKQLTETTERLLECSRKLAEQAETFTPLTHNARGAGRKKDPLVDIKKEKFARLCEEGKTRDEIMEELGIGKSTYYRYVKEAGEEG